MASPRQKQSELPEANPRKAVVVLGMHRSGTSALCGALDLLGVHFGQHLMAATDANEKGHWEHEEIVRAHDRLLSSLGSWWDDDEPLPAGWDDRDIAREIRTDLLAILERDFAQSSFFGLKDPRMCRLMPLWFPIFQTLRAEPHFVLVVRHPWEVAQSLAKRDGIEHSKSYLLWLDHVVQAESATRSHKRSFVRYEEMMDDPVAILGALREELGIDLSAPSQIEAPLRDFLDPSLRHHQFIRDAADQRAQAVPQLALDFYEAIRKASTPAEISTELVRLATEYNRGRELFLSRSVRTKKLTPEEVAKVSLKVSSPPDEVGVSARFWLDATVTNETGEALFSASPFPVRLTYHWIEKTTRQMIVWEGKRSGLFPALDPNSTRTYPLRIVAPSEPGDYILQTTIVQDGACWFEQVRPDIVQEFGVSVRSAPPEVIEKRARTRITIGIPIYRGQSFLEESLAIVQSQTYSEVEIILSLDGPDPECEAICQKFLGDSRFRLVIQPRRLGWMNHTNWLMAQVQTEFWHLQEQDDLIEPAFLERLLEHALAHPNAAAVFSDVRTFGSFDIQISMSSVVGAAVTRQLKLIYEHFQGVAPLGLIRTEALRLCGGLPANEFENFAADTTLMAGLERWGELHRVPSDLYRKRVHAESTHATWWTWETDRRSQAWQAHCLDMLHQALLVDTTPSDRRLLWLAVVHRLVSPPTANLFLPIAEWTVTQRTDMLDSFLRRARISAISIPKALEATWDEIDGWTKGFYWMPPKSPEQSTTS